MLLLAIRLLSIRLLSIIALVCSVVRVLWLRRILWRRILIIVVVVVRLGSVGARARSPSSTVVRCLTGSASATGRYATADGVSRVME